MNLKQENCAEKLEESRKFSANKNIEAKMRDLLHSSNKTSRKKIVFVTTDLEELPYLELKLVADLLKNNDVNVIVASYLDHEFDWTDCDLVNFNSCTKYYQNAEKFRDFLTKISQLKIKTINPVSAILWNLEKKYLKDLDNAGFAITKTIWVEKKQTLDLENEISKLGWKKIIIKPSLSAGSFNTEIFEISQIEKAQNHLQKIVRYCAAMIQEFIPQISEIGEYSAIFLNKKFSHLVLKTPANGDFRAGIRQGANVVALEKEQYCELINYAEKIVNHITENLLYARVDLVVSNKIYLMELELIEPLLYSDFTEDFANKYVSEILKELGE